MAQKKISDLTLRSDFDGTCNLPTDDASQSWRVTGAQMLAYMIANLTGLQYSQLTLTGGIVNADIAAAAAIARTKLATHGLASKTGAYTLALADDTILADASGGAFTLSLPTAASASGKMFRIKRTDNTPQYAVTIDPDSAELIDGVATRALYTQGEEVLIQSNGTAWIVVMHNTNGPIQTFTPAWTSTGTAPAIGNGTLNGWWWRRGDRVKGRVRLAFGSTTTIGTLFYKFGLPTGIALDTTKHPVHATSLTANSLGKATLLDSGAATYPADVVWDATNSLIMLAIWYHSAYMQVNDNVRATVPATWANGDTFEFDFEFPVTNWWV